MSAKKVAAQNLNKIINKFRFSGGVFCSPIVVQNESPRILTKERGIWRKRVESSSPLRAISGHTMSAMGC